MNFDWGPEHDAFRRELRAWLDEHATTTPGRPAADGGAYDLAASIDTDPAGLAAEVESLRDWQRQLAAAGFVGVHWPVAHGGRGLGWLDNFILQEELARAHAPEIVNRIGVNLVGPTLLAHGSDDQKRRWLPGILPADELWAQLFSEPNAGSDLAALETTAIHDGENYVVSGQKVWSSYAQFARWGICLARTDPGARKQAGITMLVVDMQAPGVDVRPLRQMTGESEFNEVFLDEVIVPKAWRIGTENEGWQIASTTLGHERGTSPRQLVVHMMLLDELKRLAAVAHKGNAGLPASLRQAVAQAEIEVTIFRLHNFRTLSALEHDGSPGPGSSVVKLFWSEMSRRMHETATELLGPHAIAGEAVSSRLVRNYLYYRAATIFAGTSEIQRNVIAERALGLPREPVAANRA